MKCEFSFDEAFILPDPMIYQSLRPIRSYDAPKLPLLEMPKPLPMLQKIR